MKQLKLAAVALAALVTLVVVLQNIAPVSVSLLLWGPITLPIALLLFLAVLAGFFLGISLAYLVLRRRREGGPQAP